MAEGGRGRRDEWMKERVRVHLGASAGNQCTVQVNECGGCVDMHVQQALNERDGRGKRVSLGPAVVYM